MSFKKKEWTLILNDLIQTYPNIDFIWRSKNEEDW
jgi:hypothetical protein